MGAWTKSKVRNREWTTQDFRPLQRMPASLPQVPPRLTDLWPALSMPALMLAKRSACRRLIARPMGQHVHDEPACTRAGAAPACAHHEWWRCTCRRGAARGVAMADMSWQTAPALGFTAAGHQLAEVSVCSQVPSMAPTHLQVPHTAVLPGPGLGSTAKPCSPASLRLLHTPLADVNWAIGLERGLARVCCMTSGVAKFLHAAALQAHFCIIPDQMNVDST
jgi:hypothetical protein